MKKHLLFYAVAAIALAGCTVEDNGMDASGSVGREEVHMTVSAASTRTSIDETYASVWREGDRIGLFYDTDEVKAGWTLSATGNLIKNGTYQNLPYLLAAGYDGAAGGMFEITVDAENDHPVSTMLYTGNFYWQSGASSATFHACYPYRFSGVNGGHMDKAEAFPYVLTAVQGGTLESVAALDLACGSVTVERGAEEYVEADLAFAMRHLFAVLEFEVVNSTGAEFMLEGVKAAAPSGICGEMTVDLTRGTVAGAAGTTVTATLEGGRKLADGQSTKVYMVVVPADCTNSTFTVQTSGGNVGFEGGKLFEAGHYYTKRLEVESLGGGSAKATLTFENAELGDLVLDGYNPTTYHSVLAGKSLATKCTDENNDYLYNSMVYDGVLYTENGIGVGSFYSDFEELYGGKYDTFYGFVMSSNNDVETAAIANQYSVYSASNGGNKFAVAYDGSWWSPSYQMVYGTYDLPTIVLDRSGVVRSAMMANTTYTYKMIAASDPDVNYAVKAMGYLEGSLTASVSVELAKGGNVLSDWTKVDLGALGTVDKVVFTVDWTKTSSEVNSPEKWLPFYFCIDDVEVEFE